MRITESLAADVAVLTAVMQGYAKRQGLAPVEGAEVEIRRFESRFPDQPGAGVFAYLQVA